MRWGELGKVNSWVLLVRVLAQSFCHNLALQPNSLKRSTNFSGYRQGK
jgi:hypothetical protein